MKIRAKIKVSSIEFDYHTVRCEGTFCLKLRQVTHCLSVVLLYRDSDTSILYAALYKSRQEGQIWASIVGPPTESKSEDYDPFQFTVLQILSRLVRCVMPVSSSSKGARHSRCHAHETDILGWIATVVDEALLTA
jgi:hypothetical protein